jgi:two-component system LytT family sensor kinase
MRWVYRVFFWGSIYWFLSFFYSQQPIVPLGICSGIYYSNRLSMRTLLSKRKYWLYTLSFVGLWVLGFNGLKDETESVPNWLMGSKEGKLFAGLTFISIPGFILAFSFQATLTKDWFDGFSILDKFKFNLKKMKFEKEAVEYKLVQGQLSPHLLKNILTVIHAMVLTKQPEAADSVVSLKEILDYLLYESNPEKKGSLIKEVHFAKEILRLRSLGIDNPNKIVIDFPTDDELTKYEIPPLILIPFIENVFTHCNLNEPDGKAEVNLHVDQFRNLSFSVRNSVGIKMNSENIGGLGLKSLRKRLDAFYSDKYQLKTRKEGNFYQSDLFIQL